MAETLTEQNDYFVTEIDGVQTVVYVDDINFLRGDSPEIVHEGGLEFTIYGIGNGQAPSYRMVTTVDGEFATVTSTSSCTFDSCVRGMDLSIDFSSNPKTVSDGEYTEVSGDGSFYNEPLLITWGESRVEPDDWEEALETPDYSVGVATPLNNSYCGGDTGTFELQFENQVVSGDVNISVDVTNLITDQTSVIDVTVPSSGATEAIDIQIPDNTNGQSLPIVSAVVDGDEVYRGSANVGASGGDISILSAQLPDGVMEGEEYTGSMTVKNESSCNVNITTSYSKQ